MKQDTIMKTSTNFTLHRGLKTTNFYEFAEVEISIVASAAVRLQSDSLTTVGKQLLSSK